MQIIFEINERFLDQLRQQFPGDTTSNGAFSGDDREIFRPLIDSLLDHDLFLVPADYRSCVNCQSHVAEAYRDERRWARMSLANIARVGNFSSDRAIREYHRSRDPRVPPENLAARAVPRPVLRSGRLNLTSRSAGRGQQYPCKNVP
jgi:glucan phosphorylase